MPCHGLKDEARWQRGARGRGQELRAVLKRQNGFHLAIEKHFGHYDSDRGVAWSCVYPPK